MDQNLYHHGGSKYSFSRRAILKNYGFLDNFNLLSNS